MARKLSAVEKSLMDKLAGDVGENFSIDFKPDQSLDESYLLLGSQDALVSNISLLMAIRQLLESKDIGKFMGTPYEQWLAQAGGSNTVSLQIHTRLRKIPPWEPLSLYDDPKLRGRNSLPKAQITIPNVGKTNAGNWTAIKNAVGGASGYMYGPCYAIAHIKSKKGEQIGKGNQMKVYAASIAEAKSILKACMALSIANKYTISTGTEDNDEGQRLTDPGFRKPEIRMYPAFYFIHSSNLLEELVNKVKEVGKPKGRSTILGKKFEELTAIPLFTQIRTPAIDKLIKDALTYSPK